jgi:paraquat-inducible protein B
MTQNNTGNDEPVQIPTAVVKTKKSFSIVWVVPLVAALIGGWMIYKALAEKGPVIKISFQSAEGLEAGKTKIKYKDVEIGQVESIHFGPDLATVIVTAELPKQTALYLTDKTRFWVVRARISSGEVRGLGTLLGGAYIEIDPNKDGQPKRNFIGLEQPPVIMTDAPGRHFNLKAGQLGSLKLGSPVYYREIQAGKVEYYSLADNGQDIDIRIFINHPYQKYIRKHTRFWNASGIDLSLGADGLKVNTQSIVSIMSGGLAFDNFMDFEQDEPVADDDVFNLYDRYQDALKEEYTVKHYWRLNFTGSVRGLNPGAPVEFRGIRVGQVLDGELHFGEKASDMFVSVLIETEPERFVQKSEVLSGEELREFYDTLVAQGLRAQLKTGSLLTGQLYVDLEFHLNAPPDKIVWIGEHPDFPTVQTTSEEVLTIARKMADRLESFPIQQIGRDLQTIVENLKKTIQQFNSDEVASIISNFDKITRQISESDVDGMVANLNRTIENIDLLIQNLNTDAESEFKDMLVQAHDTMQAVEQMLSAESAFSQGTTRTLKEVADAAVRIRALADYLERHPEALIRGKE